MWTWTWNGNYARGGWPLQWTGVIGLVSGGLAMADCVWHLRRLMGMNRLLIAIASLAEAGGIFSVPWDKDSWQWREWMLSMSDCSCRLSPMAVSRCWQASSSCVFVCGHICYKCRNRCCLPFVSVLEFRWHSITVVVGHRPRLQGAQSMDVSMIVCTLQDFTSLVESSTYRRSCIVVIHRFILVLRGGGHPQRFLLCLFQ